MAVFAGLHGSYPVILRQSLLNHTAMTAHYLRQSLLNHTAVTDNILRHSLPDYTAVTAHF